MYFCGVTVAKRELLERIGGWRGLNWYEDSDLWYRAKKIGAFEQIDFPIMIRKYTTAERRSFGPRLKHRYLTYKEFIRASLPRQEVDLRVRATTFPIYAAAWIAAKANPLPPLNRDEP